MTRIRFILSCEPENVLMAAQAAQKCHNEDIGKNAVLQWNCGPAFYVERTITGYSVKQCDPAE